MAAACIAEHEVYSIDQHTLDTLVFIWKCLKPSAVFSFALPIYSLVIEQEQGHLHLDTIEEQVYDNNDESSRL